MAYARSPDEKIYQGIEQEAFLMLDDAECLVETKLVIQHIMLDNLHSAIDHPSNSVPIERVLGETGRGYLRRPTKQSPEGSLTGARSGASYSGR